MSRELAQRVVAHDLPLHAAALAYTTLVALVPFLTVVFAVAAQVDPARAEALLLRLAELFPFSPTQVQKTLATITKRAAGLGLVSLAFSVISALVAFWQVDSILLRMAKAKRRRILRLSSFLLFLLVGPVLLAGLLALPRLLPAHSAPWLAAAVGFLTRTAAGPLALVFIYRLVPPTRPRWGAAVVGALSASALLWLISRGVTLYWKLLPELDLIYGPLSLLLLFLLSLMLSWLSLLVGAEIALGLGQVATAAPKDSVTKA
ncbi:MAG: YihY/virulence factor BrkB family protein [Thermoanaerobaculum sp.]